MEQQDLKYIEDSIYSRSKDLSEIQNKKNRELILLFPLLFDFIKDREQIKQDNLSILNPFIPILSSIIHEIIERQESVVKEKKERFNVFDCLTKHHLEQLHTKFISYLLDVNGKHDCGDLFLKEFLEILKEDNPLIREILSFQPLNLLSSKIFEPKNIGRSDNDPEIYGLIDIFIEIPSEQPMSSSINIAIENKIWAIEQEDQIKRYVLYCKKRLLQYNQKYITLYLTLDGKESQESGNESYFCISYRQTILQWLNRIIANTNQYLLIQAGIFFYKKMIESNILHLPSNHIIMEIKDILLKEENLIFLKYGSEIIETIKDIRKQLRKDFFQRIAIELGKKYRIVPVAGIIKVISANEIYEGSGRGINIEDDQFTYNVTDTEKIIFAIEHNDNDVYYGLFGITKSNGKNCGTFDSSSLPISKTIEEILRNKLQYSYEQPDDSWFMWKYYFPLKKGESFASDSLNYEFATNCDKIVLRFVNEIEYYLQMWQETIKEIK